MAYPDNPDRISCIDFPSAIMHGSSTLHSVKRLKDLAGVFQDQAAWQAMDDETLIYSVQWEEPIPHGTEGGLFWGTTTIEPGCVGDEYFMTRGHFHSRRNRGEYYCTVQGVGRLVLMEEDGSTRTENMSPGSLHYIPGYTAHRVANIGDTSLSFWACWPSDAGHDYDAIAAHPFGVRIFRQNSLEAKPQR